MSVYVRCVSVCTGGVYVCACECVRACAYVCEQVCTQACTQKDLSLLRAPVEEHCRACARQQSLIPTLALAASH